MVAEDVDLVLEDSQDLADGCDIKEGVDWGKENSFESGLENVGSEMSVMSLYKVVSYLCKEYSDKREERSFAHVGLMGISLLFRVNQCVLSIHTRDVIIPEFLELSIASEKNDWNRTSNKCPELCVGVLISIDIFIFFVLQELSNNLVRRFVYLTVDATEFLKLFINLLLVQIQHVD